jgi:hypothetical protein
MWEEHGGRRNVMLLGLAKLHNVELKSNSREAEINYKGISHYFQSVLTQSLVPITNLDNGARERDLMV